MPRLRWKRTNVEELIDLRPPSMTLGRDRESGVSVADPQASRKHCIFESQPGGAWKLRDLESRNGTRVNGMTIREHLLRDGDEIRVGDNLFVYEGAAAPPAHPTPPMGVPAMLMEAPGTHGEMTPATYRAPMARRLRQEVQTWPGMLLAIGIVMMVMWGTLRWARETSVTSDPVIVAAEARFREGMRLKEAQDFAGSLRELREIPPSAAGCWERAQPEIAQLRRALEMAGQLAAEEKPYAELEAIRRFALEHGDRPDEIGRQLATFLARYPKSIHAAKAEEMLQGVKSHPTTAPDDTYRQLSQAVDELLRDRSLGEAAAALRQFLAEHPADPLAPDARKRLDEVLSEGQVAFTEGKRRAEEMVQQRRWKEARERYDGLVLSLGKDEGFAELILLAERELKRIATLEGGGK